MWNVWLQIRGNLKYDLLKKLAQVLGQCGMLVVVLNFVTQWLSRPVQNRTLLAVLDRFQAGMLLVGRAMSCRLMMLAPRLEWVSQYQNGTGYKRPGRDAALVLPIKNQPRWWHSGLAEGQRLSAHIDFFSEDGRQLESCYHALWVNEQNSEVSMGHGEVKELIVAVKEQGVSGSTCAGRGRPTGRSAH